MTQFRTELGVLGDLAALIVLLTTGKIHLYKDDGFVPDQQSTLADLNAHEADYTGYTAGGVAMAGPLGPYQDGLNQWAENFPTVLFQPTGPVTTSNDIRGVYFEDKNNLLQQVWIFDEAVSMATTLDKILVDAKFFMSAPTNTI